MEDPMPALMLTDSTCLCSWAVVHLLQIAVIGYRPFPNPWWQRGQIITLDQLPTAITRLSWAWL